MNETMHIRCPHCQNAIEIVGDQDITDVNCPSCGSAFNLIPDTTPFTTKVELIGHFELLETLGAGSFGTVWKARDTQLDRLVAVKIPRHDQVTPQDSELFLREARAAAQVKHPGIVAVHEVGRQDGMLYIVSDFIQGLTLADRLTAGPLPLRDAAELLSHAADALHHAHQAGVIHRDLKPSNIMLDSEGRPHLLDFGLAKREAGEITMTVEGRVLGTAAYMSPEQARGEGHHVNRTTDIYSLGVILFELLTGERPFRGNVRMLLHQMIHEEPPSPRKLNSRVPRDLETICLKCLEKDPRRRYSTAADFATELRNWLSGRPILARPVNRLARVWRWARRNPGTAGLSAAVVTALLAGTSVSTWFAIAAHNQAVAEARERQRADGEAGRANLEANRAKQASAMAKAEAVRATNAAVNESHARQAEQSQRRVADQERARAEEQLGRLLVSSGMRFINEGDVSTSLIWFVEALRLDAENYDRDQVHRLRLGLALRKSPVLSALWTFERPVRQAEFSPDGQSVAILSERFGSNSFVRVWDAVSGEPITSSLEHESPLQDPNAYREDPHCMDWSPDGKWLAMFGKGHLCLWDVAQPELIAKPIAIRQSTRQNLNHLEFSRDGRYVLVGTGPGRNQSGEREIHVLEIPSGAPAASAIRGFKEHLSHVEFSPDGESIAVAQFRLPAEVSVWDWRSQRQRIPPISIGKGHLFEVERAAFSPDGQSLLITGSERVLDDRLGFYKKRGVARMWNISEGTPLTPLLPHRRSVTCAAISPDGELAATGTGESEFDGSGVFEAWIWNTRSGLPPVPPLRHLAAVTHVAFSPKGESLLTVSADRTARVWDVKSGDPLTPPLHVRYPINSASFSPSGDKVLLWGGEKYLDGGEARIYDWKMPGSQRIQTNSSFNEFAFSPDRRFVVSCSGITSYGAEDHAQLAAVDGSRTVALGHDHAYHAHFSANSSLVAVGTGTQLGKTPRLGRATIWDVQTATTHGPPLDHDSPVIFTQLSPDGRFLFAVTGSEPLSGHEVWLWDLNSHQAILSKARLPSGFADARFTPDGQRVVVGLHTSVQTLDMKTRIMRPAINFGSGGNSLRRHSRRIAISPDGRRALVCFSGPNANFVDLETNEPVGPILTGENIDHVEYSPDGRSCLTIERNRVRIWDPNSGRPLTPPLSHEALVEDAGYGWNGRAVVTCSRDHTVRVWDAHSGDLLAEPIDHGSFVQQAVVTNDGKRLIVQVHSQLEIWDCEPIQGPVDDIARLCEILACQRIDNRGDMVPLAVGSAPLELPDFAPRTAGEHGPASRSHGFATEWSKFFQYLTTQPRPAKDGFDPSWARLRHMHSSLIDSQINRRSSR